MRPVGIALLLATTALLSFGLSPAFANPAGSSVAAGRATVAGEGSASVTVSQATDKAIINWRTFNIGNGEFTTFIQPGSDSVTLNRVTGGLGRSTIDGSLRANGKVFLINPDGILFGPQSIVDVGGLVATTSDITNDDFMAGRYVFRQPGRADASVVNAGTITANNGGFAALVAPGVRNEGTISARLGTIGLAAGNGFTLDFYGDQLITLAVDDTIASDVTDAATGQPLDALVRNSGLLKADGGVVQLTAAAARKVVDAVINNTGVIEANSVGLKNGKIILGARTTATKPAGTPVQKVKVAGKLTASGKNARDTGGTVQITGEDIALAGTSVDASGSAGGGTVLIGGDVGGGKPAAAVAFLSKARLEAEAIPTATRVVVDTDTKIDASATDLGNGGKIVTWADFETAFAGTIFANGGATGGDGGFTEVSGKGVLSYDGLADLRAPNGRPGTLLLDPTDLIIQAAGPTSAAGSVSQYPSAQFGFSRTKFTGNLETSILTVASLENALALGDVTVVTGSGGNQAGDITIASSFSWSGGPYGSDLLLSAHRNIYINNGVNIVGARGLRLRADNTGTGIGTVSFLGSGTATVGGWTEIFYNPLGGYSNPTSFPVIGPSFQAYMLVNTENDLAAIQQNPSGFYAVNKSDPGKSVLATQADASFLAKDADGSWRQAFTGDTSEARINLGSGAALQSDKPGVLAIKFAKDPDSPFLQREAIIYLQAFTDSSYTQIASDWLAPNIWNASQSYVASGFSYPSLDEKYWTTYFINPLRESNFDGSFPVQFRSEYYYQLVINDNGWPWAAFGSASLGVPFYEVSNVTFASTAPPPPPPPPSPRNLPPDVSGTQQAGLNFGYKPSTAGTPLPPIAIPEWSNGTPSSKLAWPFAADFEPSASFLDPSYGQDQDRQHLGLDLPAPVGTQVLSPVSGRIYWINIDETDSFNSMLVIQEYVGGVATGRYVVLGHIGYPAGPLGDKLRGLKKDAVLAGGLDYVDVRAGSPIGVVLPQGGPSTGPHLHLGLRTRPITRLIEKYDHGEAGWGRAPLETDVGEAASQGWLDPAAYLP